MSEHTLEEATEESYRDAVHVEMPPGIRWEADVQSIIDQHDKAIQDWDTARLELWDALESYETAVAADRAALKRAAIEGEKDPGDSTTQTATRAVQYAYERCKHFRVTADKIVGANTPGNPLQTAITRNVHEYLWQAVEQAEFYTEAWARVVMELRDKFGVAAQNMQTAEHTLAWFSDQQDVVSFDRSDSLAEMRWPQPGRRLDNIRDFKRTIERLLPEIEQRTGKLAVDAQGYIETDPQVV